MKSLVPDKAFLLSEPLDIFHVMAFLKCPFSQLETSVEEVENAAYLTSVTSGFNIKTSVKLSTVVTVCLKEQMIFFFF